VDQTARPDVEILDKQSGEIKIWDATSGKEARALKGHTSTVSSVAFSPDGKRIVTGSNDSSIKIWDAATGETIRSLKGHTSAVLCVAFSKDGTRIASGSHDGKLMVWDSATGEELASIKGHAKAIKGVAFSPEGKWIVSGSEDSTLKFWNPSTGAEVATVKTNYRDYGLDMALGPDGKRIVVENQIWDVDRVLAAEAAARGKRQPHDRPKPLPEGAPPEPVEAAD
jgi:WD40 repeat protein